MKNLMSLVTVFTLGHSAHALNCTGYDLQSGNKVPLKVQVTGAKQFGISKVIVSSILGVHSFYSKFTSFSTRYGSSKSTDLVFPNGIKYGHLSLDYHDFGAGNGIWGYIKILGHSNAYGVSCEKLY